MLGADAGRAFCLVGVNQCSGLILARGVQQPEAGYPESEKATAGFVIAKPLVIE